MQAIDDHIGGLPTVISQFLKDHNKFAGCYYPERKESDELGAFDPNQPDARAHYWLQDGGDVEIDIYGIHLKPGSYYDKCAISLRLTQE